MIWGLGRGRRGNGAPLARGPRGRILFLGAFNGGVGGVERLTRTFANWVETSGFSATMVFQHTLGPGPFAVTDSDRIRTLDAADWSGGIQLADWDFVYVVPPGGTSTDAGVGRARGLSRSILPGSRTGCPGCRALGSSPGLTARTSCQRNR